MNQKGIAHIIVVGILMAGISAVFGYVFLNSGLSIKNPENPTQQIQTENTNSFNNISGIFTGDSGGCINVFVFKTNDLNNIGVSVRANRDNLNLASTTQTFNLEEIKSEDLKVELFIGDDIRELYCNDAINSERPEYRTLIGKSGEVSINIPEITDPEFQPGERYEANVFLKNLIFIEENGKESDMIIEELNFDNVEVGWFPG